ncbi:gamma-glutamylcyclotransferase [Chromobacterium haemolyticum]|uniref:gamma-glutamylcyclotransferase n=1 Tax=Chromobacterium haemolyticum TaxID=394935 RepID=UPI0009E07790|nr:gamma-glutamylcyclotransferase [Chromobacterium haemolyticum]QOD80977.1 gamma-glutamylcyclotransferase [Chromobacterium haemolyticum]
MEPEKGVNECVVHDHPVPASELGRYSVDRDPHSEQDIARYVEISADEKPQHVERVKREIVLGEMYDIWDVTTDQGRWWVITNLTNLYSQKYFPSLDYTISFHIGLMARLRSKEGSINPDEPTPFDEVIRRVNQAQDRHDAAVEVEDFQAVGMLIREGLLSLVSALSQRVQVDPQAERPQKANFIAWSDLLANSLFPGSSHKDLRQLLKNTAKDAWQVANWLTHTRNASRTASAMAMHSCQTTVGHFIQALEGGRAEKIGKCPVCQSSDIRSHFDVGIPPEGDYYASCGVCDWTDYPCQSGNSEA